MKDTDHKIISIDAKRIWHNSTFFYDKSSKQTACRRNAPQHNNDYKCQVHVGITLIGEKLDNFPLRSESRQGCLLLLLLFKIILELLARAIK
jgi:hypothetical protein